MEINSYSRLPPVHRPPSDSTIVAIFIAPSILLKISRMRVQSGTVTDYTAQHPVVHSSSRQLRGRSEREEGCSRDPSTTTASIFKV